jgi:hypothetical protein
MLIYRREIYILACPLHCLSDLRSAGSANATIYRCASSRDDKIKYNESWWNLFFICGISNDLDSFLCPRILFFILGGRNKSTSKFLHLLRDGQVTSYCCPAALFIIEKPIGDSCFAAGDKKHWLTSCWFFGLNSFIIWRFSYSGSSWTIQCPYRSWGTNVSKCLYGWNWICFVVHENLLCIPFSTFL